MVETVQLLPPTLFTGAVSPQTNLGQYDMIMRHKPGEHPKDDYKGPLGRGRCPSFETGVVELLNKEYILDVELSISY